MRVILFSFFVFLFFTGQSFAQVETGKWRMLLSPYIGKKVIYAEGMVYGILENGIIEYDEVEEEQTLWTNANYLSDVSPTAIVYDAKSKNVIIGYESGNIDFLRNNKIYNLPAIKQANLNGFKRINDIKVNKGLAYLCTGVGIVVVDIQKREVKDTYFPSVGEVEITGISFLQDSIYALTNDTVYVGSVTNSYLADPAQWHKKQDVPDYFSQGRYEHIETFDDRLYLVFKSFSGKDTLYSFSNGNREVFLEGQDIEGLNSSENELMVITYSSVLIYDKALQLKENIWGYIYQGSTELIYAHPLAACKGKKGYYIADRDCGINWSLNTYESKDIGFPGPRYNEAYRLEWKKGKLSIACGGIKAGAGPYFSRKGGSTMENENWGYTEVYSQAMLDPTAVWDFVSTAINPTDPEEVAYGTISGVPIVLTKKNVVVDTFTVFNSTLEFINSTNLSFVMDMEYDKDGNLWVLNSQTSKPLKVREKEGLWYDFNLGSTLNGKEARRLIIDHNGVKWASFRDVGLVAFDDRGTISNANDDRYRIFTTGENDGDLPSSNVYAIAADFDNNIWIGTEEGMRVLYNSESVFDASPGQYNFQKLLIEYGENVEIVLGTTEITAIQVDGANRKWIGTASSGVFLLSPDGLEVIKSFTAENSPLTSNSILDIAINQENGEVYFITENGLISYRSDATQGDDEYSNVIVFPNPVYPNFDGVITMQGIAYNSDVKITDVSGRLVYQTHSNGGTATWDGRTTEGERVKTGVYLIWTSIDSEDYKGRKVGKVLIIN